MRYALIFTYNGTNYFGYQIQKEEKTIQEEIETILSRILNSPIRIMASGRTDRGVHALKQVAAFDIDKYIDINKLKASLNALLPKDIRILKVVNVPISFHPRYSVKRKTYLYIIHIGEDNPFLYNYVYNLHKPLNLNKIRKGMKLLLGEHNFMNFCTNKEEESYQECIYSFTLNKHHDYLFFEISGSGFKRYMVRMIIGSLLAYERDEISLEEIKKRLDNNIRNTICFKAPGCGLYLKDIVYDEEFKL